MKIISLSIFVTLLVCGCFNDSPQESIPDSIRSKIKETKIPANSLIVGEYDFDTRPRNVLLTGNNEHRLTAIYKLNFNQRSQRYFTGSNEFYQEYRYYNGEEQEKWNNHHLPGFEIVSGYNMVNVSHFNIKTDSQNTFFARPVLIKNLYYPTFRRDSLNGKPILRNNYFVSVFDEDTNKDGLINPKDLRRFYYFDIDGKNQEALIPLDYAVTNSEYDPGNDRMYIFARKDENRNGQFDIEDPVSIFWIDLKNPKLRGVQYSPE